VTRSRDVSRRSGWSRTKPRIADSTGVFSLDEAEGRWRAPPELPRLRPRKIDVLLAAQGWDTLDTNAVRFEVQ
jgi:hypothetical protein